MPRKTVVRLIVIEGEAEWVDITLGRNCLVPNAGDVWRTGLGNNSTIKCLERIDKYTKRLGGKWRIVEGALEGETMCTDGEEDPTGRLEST